MDGAILICLLCMYFTLQFGHLILSRSKRNSLRSKNAELKEKRKIISTDVDDQLAYLDLKDPIVDTKFKWSWKKAGIIVGTIAVAIMLFRGYRWLFRDVFGFESIPLWVGILCLIIVPIIINWTMSKFGLQSNDELRVLTKFRWRKE